jgi:hypothetical protein
VTRAVRQVLDYGGYDAATVRALERPAFGAPIRLRLALQLWNENLHGSVLPLAGDGAEVERASPS